MTTATTATWGKEVEQSKGLVLVDFFGAWCAPCKAIGKTLEALDVPDLKIVKVDVDESPELAKSHSIKSVPTLWLYVDGKRTESIVGLVGEAKIKSLVNLHR